MSSFFGFFAPKATKQESGFPRMRTSSMDSMPLTSFSARVSKVLVCSTNPSLPTVIKEAQAAATTAPDLDPAMVGEMYSPPVQSVTLVNWCFLMSLFLYRTTEVPLWASPYLWVSKLMLVTPSIPKSMRGLSNPASFAKGMT